MPRVVVALAVALAFAIGDGVNNDGDGYERHSAEEQKGIGGGADEVTGNRTDYKREADADRKCNREAGDIDGGDQQQIGDIEDHTAADGPEHASRDVWRDRRGKVVTRSGQGFRL